MKKNLIIFLVSQLFIGVCYASSEEAIKEAVLKRMKDPESTRFGEITIIEEKLACATVNSKNSLGGYVGDKQLALKKNNEEWSLETFDSYSHSECVREWPKFDVESTSFSAAFSACYDQKKILGEIRPENKKLCDNIFDFSHDERAAFVNSWNKERESTKAPDLQ